MIFLAFPSANYAAIVCGLNVCMAHYHTCVASLPLLSNYTFIRKILDYFILKHNTYSNDEITCERIGRGSGGWGEG